MCGAEGDGRHRAHLGVDLVAHGHVHAQAGAQSENFGGLGEPGASGLDADRVAAAREQLAGSIPGGGHRLVTDHRDGGVLDETTSAHRFLGIAGLLEQAEPEAVGLAQHLHGLVGGPAAVGVEVDFDVVAQALAQHPARLDVQLQRAAANLELEGGDPIVLAETAGLIQQFLGRFEPEHVGDAQRVGPAAEHLVHRRPERLARQVPQCDVDRSLGHLIVDGAVHDGVHLLPVQGVQSDHLVGEEFLDHVRDRGLGLAVGVGARRSIGLTDQALVCVDPHQHVVGGGHRA